VPDPPRAVALLAHLRSRLGDRLTAFELVSRPCLEAVLAHVRDARDPLGAPHPWYVLAEASDSGPFEPLATRVEQALGEALEQGTALDASIAHSHARTAALWRLREMIPEAQFSNVKHDIAVAVSQIPAFIERAGRALQVAYPGVAVWCFGHVGDGNLHYNVGDAALTAEREKLNRIVYDVVAALGGSISAEHGLGQLKREEITRHKDALELELMRALKRTLDPQGLMNPGKVL
jgi:FAD/FMN-containing dehydrogenase